MTVERQLTFKESLYASNGPIESTFKAAAFRELGIALDGSTSGGAPAGTLHYTAPWGVVGPLELNVGGQQRFRCDAQSLYHLSAIYNGGYAQKTATVAVGAFVSRMVLPFHKMLDGAGLDATGLEAFLRGTWRPVSYWSGTAPTQIDSTTRLRPYCKTAYTVPPGGFHEPEFQQSRFDISAATSGTPFVMNFEKSVFLPGLLIEAMDANGGGGTDAAAAVDGLIRRISVQINRPGQPQIDAYLNATWGQLRGETCLRSGFAGDDETASAGVVWVPLYERRGGARRDALFLEAGSSLTITIDNQSTVEGGYTAVAAAAGDHAKVLANAFLAKQGASIASSASAIDERRTQFARRAVAAGANPARARAWLNRR